MRKITRDMGFAGVMDLKNKKQVGYRDEPWYRVTLYDVPFRGVFDQGRVAGVLNKNAGTDMARYGKFGGFSTYNVKGDNGDGTFRLEQCYHMGD